MQILPAVAFRTLPDVWRLKCESTREVYMHICENFTFFPKGENSQFQHKYWILNQHPVFTHTARDVQNAEIRQR